MQQQSPYKAAGSDGNMWYNTGTWNNTYQQSQNPPTWSQNAPGYQHSAPMLFNGGQQPAASDPVSQWYQQLAWNSNPGGMTGTGQWSGISTASPYQQQRQKPPQPAPATAPRMYLDPPANTGMPGYLDPGMPGYNFNPEASRAYNAQSTAPQINTTPNGNVGINGPLNWGGQQGTWFGGNQPLQFQTPQYQVPEYVPPPSPVTLPGLFTYDPINEKSGSPRGDEESYWNFRFGMGNNGYTGNEETNPNHPMTVANGGITPPSMGGGGGLGDIDLGGGSSSGSSSSSSSGFDFGPLQDFLDNQGWGPFNLSLGPVISPYQQQQMINQAIGGNATQYETGRQQAVDQLSANGFSAESPALQAVNNRLGLNQAIANTQARTQIPIDVARTNAEYGLGAANAYNQNLNALLGGAIGYQNAQTGYANSRNSLLGILLGNLAGFV